MRGKAGSNRLFSESGVVIHTTRDGRGGGGRHRRYHRPRLSQENAVLSHLYRGHCGLVQKIVLCTSIV